MVQGFSCRKQKREPVQCNTLTDKCDKGLDRRRESLKVNPWPRYFFSCPKNLSNCPLALCSDHIIGGATMWAGWLTRGRRGGVGGKKWRKGKKRGRSRKKKSQAWDGEDALLQGFTGPWKGNSPAKKVSLYFGNFKNQIVQKIFSNLILLFFIVGWPWLMGEYLFR